MLIVLAVILFLASIISIEHGHDLCSSIYVDWEGICFLAGGLLGIIVSVVLLAIGL